MPNRTTALLALLVASAACGSRAASDTAGADLATTEPDGTAGGGGGASGGPLTGSPPASPDGPGPGTGVLYEPDPVANHDEMSSYPHAITLHHAGALNGSILATFERVTYTGTSPGPGFLLYRSTDHGRSFTRLGAPAPLHMPGATRALQPQLLELADGTILLSGNVTLGSALESQVLASTDHGVTWTFRSLLDAVDVAFTGPRRMWEPFLVPLDDGRLVAYYSDELATAGIRQNVVYKISTDQGVTWGPRVSVWESTDDRDRPGMPTVTRTGDGRYVMAVELCGAPGDYCRIHLKHSDDGLVWSGGTRNMEPRILTTESHVMTATPLVTWSPSGGPRGTLVITTRDLRATVADPELFAGGHGQTLIVNHDYGAPGTPWHEVTAPVPAFAGPVYSQAGYRSTVLPLDGSDYFLYLTTTSASADVRNRLVFGTATLGALPYRDPFGASTMAGFQSFGGSWSASDGVLTNTSAGPGDKVVAGSAAWGDVVIEGDVRLDGPGNAGLVFRVGSPALGIDAYDGYFAGLDATNGLAFLGRARHDYTPLGAPHPVPGGVNVGAWTHLAVTAAGCTFTVTVTGATGPSSFTETDPGCTAGHGRFGARSFGAPAAFRGLSVRAL